MSDSLTVTQVGRKVASSGLCAEAAAFFLEVLPQKWGELERLLPPPSSADEAQATLQMSDLAFVLFHLALTSPEFERVTPPAPRAALYQLDTRRETEQAARLQSALTINPWDRNVFAVNGAALAVDWINGTPLRNLEGRFPDLRGGSLTGLFRDLGQILAGVAELLAAATNASLPEEERNTLFIQDVQLRGSSRRLVNILRRLCLRLERGLPDEVLWMVELRRPANLGGVRLVSSTVAMALLSARFPSPDSILDNGRTNELILALRPHHAPTFARDLKDAVKVWRAERTRAFRDRHVELVDEDCKSTVRRFYQARGIALEDCLAVLLDCLGIEVVERDEPNKPSFPDFVLSALSPRDVVIECKTKEADDGEVQLNDASDVLRKASLNGLGGAHKVTLCSPMLSPDVARKIDQCPELTVVNVDDLAEGLLRLHRQRIEKADLVNWLTTPGHAKRETLPYRAARNG